MLAPGRPAVRILLSWRWALGRPVGTGAADRAAGVEQEGTRSLARNESGAASEMNLKTSTPTPWWTSDHHPGCGCAAVASIPTAAEADAGSPLNWVGPATEPSRGPADTSQADALLIGGDNYHFLLDSSRGVGAQLEANGLTVHYTEDTSQLSATTLANKKVLVILKDGGWPPEDGSQWMTPEQEVAIEDWVLKGGGLMPLHNSLWAIPGWAPAIGNALIASHGITSWADVPLDGDSTPQDVDKMRPFRRTAGGVGGYHPAFERQHVQLINKPETHPVTCGISNYEIGDEQHYVFPDLSRVTPLLRNVGTANGGHQGPSYESCAGFAHQYGEGRVCYLGSAHTLQGMRHPMVQKLYLLHQLELPCYCRMRLVILDQIIAPSLGDILTEYLRTNTTPQARLDAFNRQFLWS